MKIIFDDGTEETCSADDQREISVAPPLFKPISRPPKHLTRVWRNPLTYAKLVTVRCANIVPGHWVMTHEGPGIKRVARVEK
jgi:hypothetical protein